MHVGECYWYKSEFVTCDDRAFSALRNIFEKSILCLFLLPSQNLSAVAISIVFVYCYTHKTSPRVPSKKAQPVGTPLVK